MTLTITDRLMRSPETRHTASSSPGSGEWRVTWLPGRVLSREQAAAAMELAELVQQMPADCDPELYDGGFWSQADSLAGMLGMAGSTAVEMVSEAPPASS